RDDVVAAEERPLDVDRHDDALAADAGGDLGHEFGMFDGGRVDRHFFDPELIQLFGIAPGLHAPSVPERHEALAREIAKERQVRAAAPWRRADVGHEHLVDFLVVENPDDIDRIAQICRAAESNGLVQAPAPKQEKGYDARLQHRAKLARSRIPNL